MNVETTMKIREGESRGRAVLFAARLVEAMKEEGRPLSVLDVQTDGIALQWSDGSGFFIEFTEECECGFTEIRGRGFQGLFNLGGDLREGARFFACPLSRSENISQGG